MKKRNMLAIAAAVVMTMMAVSGCGKSETKVAENADSQGTENVNVSETGDENTTVTEPEKEVTEEKTDVNEGSSFGLKDFEGFYYNTVSENLDDNEVNCLCGYQFNGDGTGSYYGQDIIDITWNETEIHFDDYALNYDMEPDKLIVHDSEAGDVVFDKLSGRLVLPNPYKVDVSNPEDGTYPAGFAKDDISEKDGKLTILTKIYTEDTYDIVDMAMLNSGDIIYVDGRLLEVSEVDENENGLKKINGGEENGGVSLRSVEESNCYVYFGMDDIASYSLQGEALLKISDNAKLIDNSDPSEEKTYTYSEFKEMLSSLSEDIPFNVYNCRITIENGEVIQIERAYTP